MLVIFAAAVVAVLPSAGLSEVLLQEQLLHHTAANASRRCRNMMIANVQPAVSRTPLRCRPAPYYVTAGAPNARRKGASPEVIDRNGRPCHLMQDAGAPARVYHVAD